MSTHCQVCGKPFLWMSQSLFGPYCQCIRYGYATTMNTATNPSPLFADHEKLIAERDEWKRAAEFAQQGCREFVAEAKAAEAELQEMSRERDAAREQSKIDSLIAGKAMANEIALQQRAERAEDEIVTLHGWADMCRAAEHAKCAAQAELAAWHSCAEHLAADLRGCSECCDCADCVCRESLAEFDRLTAAEVPVSQSAQAR